MRQFEFFCNSPRSSSSIFKNMPIQQFHLLRNIIRICVICGFVVSICISREICASIGWNARIRDGWGRRHRWNQISSHLRLFFRTFRARAGTSIRDGFVSCCGCSRRINAKWESVGKRFTERASARFWFITGTEIGQKGVLVRVAKWSDTDWRTNTVRHILVFFYPRFDDVIPGADIHFRNFLHRVTRLIDTWMTKCWGNRFRTGGNLFQRLLDFRCVCLRTGRNLTTFKIYVLETVAIDEFIFIILAVTLRILRRTDCGIVIYTRGKAGKFWMGLRVRWDEVVAGWWRHLRAFVRTSFRNISVRYVRQIAWFNVL